jgi:hypothetical protein
MALEKTTKKVTETLSVSSTDIDWIKSTLSQMSLKIQEVDASLSKLNQTVIGDKIYGQVGLLEKVDTHNAYIEKDKEFKSRLIGGGLVLSFVWGLVLKFWKI